MTHNPKLDVATAMMVAADYVEQKGRYDYMQPDVPSRCCDTGCALGWCGFVLGMQEYDLNAVAQKIGYVTHIDFYHAMDGTLGSAEWMSNATVAATGLRLLAQGRMGDES